MNLLKDKAFVVFVLKFLSYFCIFYYGTLLIIGLAAQGGMYSYFVDKHLDYVTGITNTLVGGSRGLLQIAGIETYTLPNFIIRITGGTGVRIAFDCVGYGVMSFWLAFVLAGKGRAWRKFLWILIGWIVLWFINIHRIALLLLAYNKNWDMPLGIDHHTWFNIVAYGAIFLMMYIFDKDNRKNFEEHAG